MDFVGTLNEHQRLAALHRYQILETLPECEFDRLTRFVRQLLNAPVVVLSFVDAKFRWLKSTQGTHIRQTERQNACCGQAIQHSGVFTADDLWADPLLRLDPMVVLEGARSYAGAPLVTPDGFRIGVLAVYDRHPRSFSTVEQAFLTDLAAMVIETLELRLMLLDVRAAQQHSEYVASHDALTGLPNRWLLLNRADIAVQHAQRTGTPLGVMVLDLDHFKTINDSLGHAAGDQVLNSVAARLCGGVRTADTVGRFGGDEFVILLPTLAHATDAALVAQKLLDLFHAPFQIEGQQLELHVSIGISIYPVDGADAEGLLRTADTAMYQAKASGKAQYCFYDVAMTVAAQEKLRLHQRLASALQANELCLHYQPQVDLRTLEVTGLEALVRWPQPDGSWIFPQQFISVAEESGLILALGEWVLRQACQQLMRWRASGRVTWSVSVNVSVRQWENRAFVTMVEQVLAETGLPAAALILEVTESVMLRQTQETLAVTQALRERGVRVALDDFGTGFSSLSQLYHLNLAQLKIDRSFVQALSENTMSVAIVDTVVQLGRRLSLSIVAEGIETSAQHDALKALQCLTGQGFLFARPMSAARIERDYLP